MSIYGTDFEMFPDLDLTFTEMTNSEDVLIQDAYKRLTTPSGFTNPAGGQFWDINTLDLKEYLGDTMSGFKLQAMKARISSIFSTESRYDIKCEVSFSKGVLTVVLNMFPSNDRRVISMVFTLKDSNVYFERVK
jgi:hypothetical protein